MRNLDLFCHGDGGFELLNCLLYVIQIVIDNSDIMVTPRLSIFTADFLVYFERLIMQLKRFRVITDEEIDIANVTNRTPLERAVANLLPDT